MKKHAQFAAAFLSGLGVTVTVFQPAQFQRLTGSDLSRMRGDVERVGASMRRVIDREHGKQTTRESTRRQG